MPKIPVFWILLLAVLLSPGLAQAAGSSVIYGNSDARECYLGANLAHLSAQSALPTCSRALRSGKLTRSQKVSTLVNRGILYTHLREYAAAFEDFDRALKLVPGFPEAYLNRGNAFLFVEQFEQAVVDYDAAIEGGSRKLHAAHYNRGLAREALKQPKLAYRDFRRAAELNPSWALAGRRVERYAGLGYVD